MEQVQEESSLKKFESLNVNIIVVIGWLIGVAVISIGIGSFYSESKSDRDRSELMAKTIGEINGKLETIPALQASFDTYKIHTDNRIVGLDSKINDTEAALGLLDQRLKNKTNSLFSRRDYLQHCAGAEVLNKDINFKCPEIIFEGEVP